MPEQRLPIDKVRKAQELYAVEDVAEILKLSREIVWRWVREGKFPPADIKLSKKYSRWSADCINEWIQQAKINNEEK